MVKRAAVVATSVVLGVAAGAGLHLVSDPFTGPATALPSPSTAAPTATPTATPTRTSTPSPAPTAAGSSPATPTASPTSSAPAFTRLALLQPAEFEQYGWARADVTDEFDGLPATPITPCTTVAPDGDGVRTGYAATYASDRTTAAEVVARFDDEQAAADAYRRLVTQIASCPDSAAGSEKVRTFERSRPGPQGVAELTWYRFRPLGDGVTRGAIGAVRAGDRVALLSLRSDVRDPAGTTRIDELLNLAGRRLV